MTTTFPHPYLKDEDDGLPTRVTGSWAQEKLFYISRYINIFTTSMKNSQWRSLRFVDLFAGPGKCNIKGTNTTFLGSPLLAITAKHPFTHYIFVDMNPDHIRALQTRCSLVTEPDIQYFTGDSNKTIDIITREITADDRRYLPGHWPSLNLAVLDPEGLELQWQTVEKLAQIGKMDLIIHYSQFGLTRNFSNFVENPQDTLIDLFFGDRQWRQIYKEQSARNASMGTIHRSLIDYYKTKLTKLGYQEIKQSNDLWGEPLITTPTTKAPMYRLLFASKNQLGHKFWKEVTKTTSYGTRRLL
jgi:three-Cys-motif partner protein